MDARSRGYVALAAITQGIAVGATFGAFSLFIQPLERDFAAPRWMISLGPTLLVFALAAGGMAAGGPLDRGAVRRVMLTGGALVSLSLLAASRATSLPLLGVLCFTAGMGVPMIGPVAGSTLIGRALQAERGRALGIVNMGAPLGAFAFAALAGLVLEPWGWRGTLALFSAITALVVFPLVVLGLPAEVAAGAPPRGTAPDEGAAAVRATGDAGGDTEATEGGLAFGELVRHRGFVLGALAFAVVAGISAGWGSQLAPFLMGRGAGLRAASLIVAASAGVAVLGTLLYGTLADRVRPAWLFGSIIAVGGGVCAVYASAASLSTLAAAALVFGVATGGFVPVYTMLLAERVGALSLGRAMGLTNLLMLPMSAASGPAAAAVYDATGSYAPALWCFVAVYGLAGVALVLADRADRVAGGGR